MTTTEEWRPPQEAIDELKARFAELQASEPARYDLGEIQLGSYRHKCERRGAQNVAVALDLKEVYWTSSDGTCALIFRQGHCKKCEAVARNSVPLFVNPAERPPLDGRVSR